MDDETYVRELFDILTNPSPSGINPADPYGQADDRIDRYDGFGRDLRVTAARVVPGEYGAMVEIGYELEIPDRPDLRGVPRHNAIRLPVSAEWRAASNLDDPADYAPMVARRLMSSVRRHVSAHQPGTPHVHTLPGRKEQWEVLLEHLGRHGEVTEVSPGRLQVVRRRDGRMRTVLITPDQWEQVLLRDGLDLFHGHVIDLLFGTSEIHFSGPPPPDEAYLVVWDGELQRSVREVLPPVRPWHPMKFVPGGSWSAVRRTPESGE